MKDSTTQIPHTLRDENVPRGFMNYEVGEQLDVLIEASGAREVTWAQDPDDESYFSAVLGNFVVNIGFSGGSPELLISNMESEVLVAQVDEQHPPEDLMRAQLAGKAYALWHLVKTQLI